VAGNRQIFEEAMRQGTNYAWDRQWEEAVAEYRKAIAELPNEVAAYVALGQALTQSGQDREALSIYQRAARLAPNDPQSVTRVAEVQENLGQQAGAVKSWLHAADMYLRQQNVDAALNVWEHVVEIAPENLSAHQRLAKAYENMKQKRKAVRQYLSIAAIYQERDDEQAATKACQRALSLAPRDGAVLTAMEALEQGRSIWNILEQERADVDYASPEDESEAEEDGAGPVEGARERALAELADMLLEEGGSEIEVTGLLLQGIDAQARGDTEVAINCYEQVVAKGMGHVAVRFSLGLLYQQQLQFEAAVEQLQEAVNDPKYTLGAYFALGECLRAQGRLDEALGYFIETLRKIDLSMAAPEQTDELDEFYDALSHEYADMRNRDAVTAFVNRIIEILSGKHWKDRLSKMRDQLDRIANGRVMGLAEVLSLSEPQRILASMSNSQTYLEQGLIEPASEECLWAIEHAPHYLPLHLHMMKILQQANQTEKAVTKSLFIADTFAVRNEMDRAMAIYEQVLNMAPMNIEVRRKLIRLLELYDMQEAVLEHRLALGDTYYELAQIESSSEEYREALQQATGLENSKEWQTRILHRLGDISFQRLDWRNAIDVYLQLKELAPEDVKVRRRLVELYFNLQRRAEAAAELKDLVAVYRSQGAMQKALDIMEEMAENRPDELELHKRCAQLAVETGDKQRAIVHLDTMGELQLQAGRVKEAVATIRAIIALGPENVDAYRELLEQIA
jgi:tetratricopeptide (TPR) repeat protein